MKKQPKISLFFGSQMMAAGQVRPGGNASMDLRLSSSESTLGKIDVFD